MRGNELLVFDSVAFLTAYLTFICINNLDSETARKNFCTDYTKKIRLVLPEYDELSSIYGRDLLYERIKLHDAFLTNILKDSGKSLLKITPLWASFLKRILAYDFVEKEYAVHKFSSPDLILSRELFSKLNSQVDIFVSELYSMFSELLEDVYEQYNNAPLSEDDINDIAFDLYDTLLPKSLPNLPLRTKKLFGTDDVEGFINTLYQHYAQNKNIDKYAAFFSDKGLTVENTLERIMFFNGK